jgi:type IV pilus assembly protein PilC
MKQQTLKCIKCGTDNSSKRTICFNCHENLHEDNKKNIANDTSDKQVIKKRVLIQKDVILPEKTSEKENTVNSTPVLKPKKKTKQGSSNIFVTLEQRLFIPTLKQRVQMYRQFHSLLKSGIPLALAMSYVEKNIAYTIKPAMREIGLLIEKGSLFSEQMINYPALFSGWEISMVAAGEKSGNLPEIMNEISNQLEIEMEMKTQVNSKTWHLKATLFVAVLIGIFLSQFFNSNANTMEGAFNVFSNSVIIMCVVMAAFMVLIIIVQRFTATKAGSVLAYNVMSRVPLYGPILKNQSILRFVNVLSAMVHAGVGAIESLQCAAEATGNRAIINKANEAGNKLSKGEVMADVISSMNMLPPETIYLIRTGENTGSLVESLKKTGEYIQLELSGLVKTLPAKMTMLVYVIVIAIVMYVLSIAFGKITQIYESLM